MFRSPISSALLVLILAAVGLVPMRAATAQVCDPGWVPGPMTTALPGTDGPVYAMVVYGSPARLIVAGEFTHVGGIAANNIAAWDGTNWSSLGGGTDGTVRSLVVYNNLLIAGGSFTSPGRRIAAWNGSSWAAMGDIGSETPSVSESVNAMQEFSGYLHVGGRFESINGVGIQTNSARYLNGQWSVAAGLLHEVRAMTVVDWDIDGVPTMLYIGGRGAGHRLAYSSDGVNSTEIDGPWNDVWSLAKWNGFLPPTPVVVGGMFDNWSVSPDDWITVNGIARLYGPGNQVLGVGLGLTNVNVPTIPNVMSMCAFGEDLFIGGTFQRAGGLPAPSIARIDQSKNSWATVAGGLMRGESKLPAVNAMCVYNGFLYVGGRFDAADNQPSIVGVQNIARWNGSIWSSVGTKPRARALASLGNRLFVGGEFGHVVTEPNGGPALNRFNILTWNGTETGCLGRGANGIVRSLLAYNTGGAFPANVVIAGGDFTTVYGDTLNPSAPIAASRVAQWVEPSIGLPGWSAMGAGLNSFVHCLTRFNGSIVAGGSFTASGATTTNRLAKYVGTPPSWQPLTSPDPGINNTVFAMKAFTDEISGQNNYLIFGGAFTAAPVTGVAANRILMRVENPVFGNSHYQALGQGFANGFVMAIERHGSGFNARTYAGGSFTMSGTTTVNRIAVLNGANWQPVGNGIGFNNVVYGLRSIGSYLYAVGAFTSVDGIAANRIARWNGSAWSAVDIGADDEANAVMAFQNEVMMGGFFTAVDSPAKVSPALARFSEFGLPWIAQQPAPEVVACGQTAEFTVTPAAGYDVTYQWRRANIPVLDGPTAFGSIISGVDTATLTIANVQPEDADLYDCVVYTLCDGVTSADAALNVIGQCPTNCIADIAPIGAPNGVVNVDDLLAVINAWGTCADPNSCPADIAPAGGNDVVNVDDLLAVINAWGSCPN